MSAYNELEKERDYPGESNKMPMYPMGVYRANDYEQQQGNTSQVYPTNVDQNNEENDCFKSAFCYPDEEKSAKKDNDDDAPMINEKYLNLEFDSCFHEHKSTRTIPIVYKINGYIFKYTKLFFYNFLVILFGFFLSFLWAIVLGITSFVLAWIWNPGLKALIIVVSTTLPAVTEPLKALFTPLVDVQARVFRQIRVQGWLNGGLLNPLLKKQDHVV